MTNPYDEYDIFDDWEEDVDPAPQSRSQGGQPSKGAKFRQQFEDLLAQNKRMSEFIDGVMRERQSETLSKKLESRSLDPQVAKFIPDNLSAADQDKWLDDNAAFFARNAAAPTTETTETTTAQTANAEQLQAEQALTTTLTPSEQAALAATTADASSAGGQSAATTSDPMAKMQSFNNEDEFWQWVRSQP